MTTTPIPSLSDVSPIAAASSASTRNARSGSKFADVLDAVTQAPAEQKAPDKPVKIEGDTARGHVGRTEEAADPSTGISGSDATTNDKTPDSGSAADDRKSTKTTKDGGEKVSVATGITADTAVSINAPVLTTPTADTAVSINAPVLTTPTADTAVSINAPVLTTPTADTAVPINAPVLTTPTADTAAPSGIATTNVANAMLAQAAAFPTAIASVYPTGVTNTGHSAEVGSKSNAAAISGAPAAADAFASTTISSALAAPAAAAPADAVTFTLPPTDAVARSTDATRQDAAGTTFLPTDPSLTAPLRNDPAATNVDALLASFVPTDNTVTVLTDTSASTSSTASMTDSLGTAPPTALPSDATMAKAALESLASMVRTDQPQQAAPLVNTLTAPAQPFTGEVYKQVVNVVAPIRQMADGDYSVTLKLHPQHLGSVEITVALQGGQINMSMNADNGATRQMLRDSMDDLRQSLNSSGLDAGSLDVGTGDSRQGREQSWTNSGPDSPWNNSAESDDFFAQFTGEVLTTAVVDGSLDVKL